MKMKNSATVLLIVFVSSTLLCGCLKNRINKHYYYKSEPIRYSWGVAGAKLHGKYKFLDNRHTRIQGSPYDLLLFFGSENYLEGSITVFDVQLIDNKTNQIIFSFEEIDSKEIERDNNEYQAYFRFSNISFEYNNMVLLVSFEFDDGKAPKKYTEKILFEKNYEEYRSNTIIDLMMSI